MESFVKCILLVFVRLEIAMSISFSVAKLRKIAASCLQDTLRNLYNVRTKLDCADKPFKSSSELPCFEITSVEEICSKIKERLARIFQDEKDDNYLAFVDMTHNILKASNGAGILSNLAKVFEKCWEVVNKWDAAEAAYVGVIPHKDDELSHFTADSDEEGRKCYLLWDKDSLGENFLGAVSRALRQIREARRQPTPSEYLAQHLAYMEIAAGKWGRPEKTRSLGTPGFRPHTQTYMSLTDPGEGHIMGTTRFAEWMEGAIVHVEHLERPNHRDRQSIESYRVPSVLDFSRVRLHVGPTAPTTYFLGRAVKDSGNFDEDFLKIVHITAAAASAAFFMGAAEVKISMEGLSTNQALRYMHALRAQVQRSRMQLLSAAWNLNQQITDDFEMGETPVLLKERLDIALKAVAITSIGGFDKVTWDGASDTYPSKCIMYQLSFEEALTVVHEAHLKGLVTYFSAGFKFDEIQHAVYAGVDGIGIGGAQVLRFMDKETGMHGPYMEENIPRILARRDEAAHSLRGRGVDLLVRLDTMFFEGSISRPQEYLRQKLFKALLQCDAEQTEELLQQLSDVLSLPREGNTPLLYRAKRLVEAEKPMLREICSEEEWDGLVKILRHLIVARDEQSLLEEYDSDPWLSIRHRYRMNQCPRDSKICFVRQTSFTVPYKS
ncbi:pnrc100 replication protein h-like [Plakobranchus ocellatus]|uniref:Pnrc100 replication protein h-like n=1 Tax=Plakobranchus ocellatus TaxID=259542 RepID=A0AAV4CUV6_9GAST|nr:pnrc100 replication protein h-like [Plakobranchus ocellatus]